MKFGNLTYEEYKNTIEAFHGTVAPGVLLGGFMVNIAIENLPRDILFDVICETKTCLPDAIQLLTPCSVGNGWLKILDFGRFAAVFYDKYTGVGIRVFLDRFQLKKWHEVETWFLKQKSKDQQDTELLFKEMIDAGTSLFSIEPTKVHKKHLKKKKMGKTVVCPICDETYPKSHGSICRGCAQELPYDLIDENGNPKVKDTLSLNKTRVEESIGFHLLHDIAKISKTEKRTEFYKGHVIQEEDIEKLKMIGKNYLYVEENNPFIKEYKHENEVALSFASAMKGQGVLANSAAQEGKINFIAEYDGILIFDEDKLCKFNNSFGVICATLKNNTLVKKDQLIAGTIAIPLYISNEDYLKAINILGEEPLLKVVPFRKAKVGILITGTEIYENKIEDKYTEIIKLKVETYGCQVVAREIAPDNPEKISSKIQELIQSGADLIIATAGLSVDPDDVTLEGIIKAGAEDVLYGLPVLPGCMMALGKIGDVQIVGIPGGGIYNKHFSFDLIFPCLLANIEIKRGDLAKLGNGGLRLL